MSEFISAQDVSFAYDPEEGQAPRNVLEGVSMQIRRGEFVALLGHNGCGKSTMAKLFNAMLLPTGGKVYRGRHGHRWTKRCIMRSAAAWASCCRTRTTSSWPAWWRRTWPSARKTWACRRRKSAAASTRRSRRWKCMTSASTRRTSFPAARSSAWQSPASSPCSRTASCSTSRRPCSIPRGRSEVLRTIHRLNREQGITIVLITHYMDEAVQADRVIVMDDGNVLTEGTPREVFAQVELLKKHQLDVPQATELTYRLRGMGFPMPCTASDEEECVAALEPLLHKSTQEVEPMPVIETQGFKLMSTARAPLSEKTAAGPM